MIFFKDRYIWNLCLQTQSAISRPLCAEIQGDDYSLPLPCFLRGEGGTRAYWTLMPHKESGRLFSCLHLPPLPSLPPPKTGKVRTACQSRKKDRFDSNKNRLSNHLVLSSPDSGEEWCVRKSREPRMRVMASSLDSAISSTSDLARPPFVSRNILPHSDYVSVGNISMGCIKKRDPGSKRWLSW